MLFKHFEDTNALYVLSIYCALHCIICIYYCLHLTNGTVKAHRIEPHKREHLPLQQCGHMLIVAYDNSDAVLLWPLMLTRDVQHYG